VTSGCSAGTAGGNYFYNRGCSVSHAISTDGSRIYWSAGNEGPGKVYLRLDGATTVPVSETQTKSPSQFLGASADGSQALFMPTAGPKADGLFLYSLASEASTRIAGEAIGLVGASEDLSYVYYASKEAIGGANAEGEAPVSGKPNLYLYHEGASTFVATLAKTDVLRSGVENASDLFSDVAPQPLLHVARATPDGSHLIFISAEPLTGYDNTDVRSGEADLEVFQYSADVAKINCVSCSPGGARPQGRAVDPGSGAGLPFAALIPGGENQLYSPRAQSEDGSRVFFTSYGPLISRDTNGVADVYEWERPGVSSCSESSAAFSAANGGCIYLISNGTSPSDSALVDISADGRDVFFTTNAGLLPQDPGLVDIYDARAGGGFPAPPVKTAACEGEACQGPLAPPNDPTPASSSFQGAGNVKEPAANKKKKAKKHKKAHKKQKHAHKRSAKGRTNR
jgi:hypothetical protein